MNRCLRLTAIFLLLSATASAQMIERRVRREPELEATPAQKALAAEILTSALDEARGLETPALRAYTLAQVANGLAQIDKKKHHEALSDAFQATLAIEKDPNTKEQLQGSLLERLYALDPATVEDELLSLAEPRARAGLTGRLVARAVERKDFDRAIELVRQTAPEAQFPYGPVSQVMAQLPPERAADRLTLFSLAVAHHTRQKKEPGMMMAQGLGTLIARFWKVLPPNTVLEAIDALLASTKADAPPGFQMTLSSREGTAGFGSQYEFTLFQVLPALKQLDSGKAERLLKEHQSLSAMMDKYPQGMQSLDPNMRETPPAPGEGGGGLSMNVSMSGGGPGSPTGARGGPGVTPSIIGAEMERQAMKVVADAETNPKQALAAAMSLPETTGQGSPRARALEGIARVTRKENPTIAKEALRELVKIAPSLPDQMQPLTLSRVAAAFLEMGDEEAASKVIRDGLRLAEKRYAKDSDKDDPNTAQKGWWPSTEMYRQFVVLAGRISPEKAFEVMKEIDDREVQLVQKVALANAWLGAGSDGMTTMVRGKDGTSMMTSRDAPGSREEQQQRVSPE